MEVKMKPMPSMSSKEELAEYIRTLLSEVMDRADVIATDGLTLVGGLTITVSCAAMEVPTLEWKYKSYLYGGRK